MDYKFVPENGSFLLKNTETGKSWDNYFWNETDKGFFITKTNHLGGSVSWLLRYTSEKVFVTEEDTPSCIYLRDDETNDCWNPAVAPTCNEVEDYLCEHGLMFSRFSSRKNGVFAEQTVTVCKDELAEVWQVKLKNNSDKTKRLSLFAFSQFDLNGFVQDRYYHAGNTGGTMFLKPSEVLFCQEINPYMPEDLFSGYIMSSEPVFAYEARLEHFFGTTGNYAVPKTVKDGCNLTCTGAAVRKRGGILQHKIELAPGEEKTIYFVLGFAPADSDAIAAKKPELIAKAKSLFDDLYERGIEKFGDLRTKCPEERINNIMNFWVQKQVSFCMLGKQAVRDNAQIVLGMLNYDTALAKQALADCIAHQYSDGHALLTWGIGSQESDIYSDPSAWLILAVCEYVKETGDWDFVNQKISFLDGEPDTVYKHLQLAAEWFMREDNYGNHGMPRIHHADWNDALNIPDENAESVFMSMMICYAFMEFAELAKRMGDTADAEELLSFREKLAALTNDVAFNGDYYVRAFSKFGAVGDKDSTNGGNIYINPQVWAILSGIVPEDRMDKILGAIDNMETECGVPLCDPPYQKYDVTVGRMSAMPPGVYENGGNYNHACAFKVMADCKVGRGENAVATLLKMIPDGNANPCEKTTTEPYVFTNCYLKHKNEDMVVGFSWQTGSSAWGLMDYYQGIVGITRNYDGLEISPNIPSSWDKVEVSRIYRGNRLNIVIENAGGKQVELYIDGNKAESNFVPAFTDNAEHNILVKLV